MHIYNNINVFSLNLSTMNRFLVTKKKILKTNLPQYKRDQTLHYKLLCK